MPPFPGEERLVTVFADLHYYFAQPTVRPTLHRFDKGSYFYIYYNSTRHTSRIEIANNPGTPEQDAFNGYIDTCRITNSYRFPTCLTIEVDGVPTSPASPKGGRDTEEWCLASADPRDATRTKYRLHTVDIYFWAQEDARLVTECFKKLLPSNQLDLADLDPEPQPEPEAYHAATRSPEQPANAMSPVVQNLENMAVTDQYGHTHNKTAVSPTSSFASHNLPPPPALGGLGAQIHSPSPAISDMSQPAPQPSVQSKPQSTTFQPMAYNPAAPAAPEPIAHREKTPPPEDDTPGMGLSQAARRDHYQPGVHQAGFSGAPSQSGYHVGQGPPTFGGGYASPPQQVGKLTPQPHQQPGGYASPPPQPPGGYTTTPLPPASSSGYGAPPSSSTTGYSSPPPASTYSQSHPDQRSSMTSTAPSFGPGAPSTLQQQSQSLHSTAAEHYIPTPSQQQQPVMTPGSQFYNNLNPPAKPLAHVQPQYADYLSSGSTLAQQTTPQPPMGGYSQYDYRQGQGQQQQHHNPYDVHQQVYQPTEQEAGTHHHSKKPSRTSTSAGDGRKESRADKVEKGVGRLFKKIEKRIG